MKKNKPDLKRVWVESNKLRKEASKLRTESNKLWVKSNKLWKEAILEVYGNIKMGWKNWDNEKCGYECHLENGKVFKP